MANSWLLPS